MTERVYYNDPYVQEFDATVVSVEPREGKNVAVLDRTAFYPTSGGQPHDTGMLGEARVVEVGDGEDGSVVHVVEGPIAPGPVHGRVDWARRFDHMQQHTGQHVLSAAFDQALQARTESFHLGAQSATIDLSRELTPAEIGRAEREANRVVWDNRPVSIRFVDAGEAARLPLRKESARTGTLRLIEVEGFDVSACGGTHVARTGEIGIIAIAGWERFKGGSRVEFVCGARALRAFGALRDTLTASVRLVSVLPSELPAGIERLQADAKDARRAIKDLQAQLAAFEAAALADRAAVDNGLHVVAAALEGWDAPGLKAIASAVAGRPGHVCALFSLPGPSAVVVARGAGVTVDCAGVLKALVSEYGGKGGGRPDLAQGGGLQAGAADLVARARTLIQQGRG